MSGYYQNIPQGSGSPRPGGYQAPGWPGVQGGYRLPGGFQSPGSYQPQPGGPYGGPGGPGRVQGGCYGNPGGGKPRSNIVIMLIVGLVGALLIGVVAYLVFGGRGRPGPKPGQPPRQSSASPKTSPTGGGSRSPTGGGSTAPAPSGTAIALGNGVYLTPPAGYTIDEQQPGEVTITDGTAFIIGSTTVLKQPADASALITKYIEQVGSKLQNPRAQQVQVFDVGSGGTAAAQCIEGTMVNSGGSTAILLCSVIGVRTADSVAARITIILPTELWDMEKGPYNETVNGVLDSLYS